ncbi:MAG: hypothetical protein UU16_C0006G0027 [Candidatus Woesebacteria bacterium GW2011_GWA2_40_7]|uniref:Uncharacterized protein n=3 Tax=Candidatus Woeseibacteriota TaxID=1752722 RepID=A0A0G0UUW6_9BACT|nr:MAG: hypothetical protein UT17_C0002G0090 [Candidatus Woesebacteria bacterium GW2011_GWB1_39_10]KKR74073.1 MAG: hypothetical protein UU16_C0006G0027 [Candidatus Woesebacteria bacterium GW2011_GWA2_40_7]KKR92559.1 MAG: hypothetical protein UU42_C0001G0163 [Candidatus Woesebacteria bacterium GW2011_GWA1_41_13b]
MLKIKSITGLFICSFAYLLICLFGVRPAYASVLSIQTLPSYINTNNFKLSCTSDGGTFQFEVSVHGGAFTTFGPVINTSTEPCIVQVDSSIVNSQTDYTFRIGGFTTSTIYDTNGPAAPSGYYKEGLSNGFKIHWTNPSDSDFSKVKIYRGETADFSADSSHEITTQPGGAGSLMTYDDIFAVDSSKTYFYDLRAIDYAGNSSDLVGDGSSTSSTTVTTASPKAGTDKVTQLPKGNGGSVLGTETNGTPTPSASPTEIGGPVSTNPGIMKWILTHKKISLGVAFGLIIISYLLFRRKKS